MVNLADAFTVAGGTCEAAGILLTVRELVRVEDRAFPERRNRLLRTWRRVQAKLGLARPVVAQFVGAADSIAVSDQVSLKVQRGPVDPDDLKARIARLEQVVDDRERESAAALAEVRRRVEDVARHHDKRLAELEGRLEREREQKRVALRDSLTLQKAYAMLFAFGAVLSTVGGVIG